MLVDQYILGIDASLSSTGYCVLDCNENIIDIGKIVTKPKVKEDDRVESIVDALVEVSERYKVNIAIIEDQFIGNNFNTGLKLSRLRGAITYALKKKKVSICYLPTSTTRKLLINSKCSKEDIAIFLRLKYKSDEKVMSLGEFNDKNNKNKNSDIFDSIAIAISYLRQVHQ